MGLESEKNAPESAFEKRFKINQELAKLKKQRETIEAGTMEEEVKSAVLVQILKETAMKETELFALDNAPQNAMNGPITAIPTQNKIINPSERLAPMGTNEHVNWDDVYQDGSKKDKGDALVTEFSKNNRGTMGDPNNAFKG